MLLDRFSTLTLEFRNVLIQIHIHKLGQICLIVLFDREANNVRDLLPMSLPETRIKESLNQWQMLFEFINFGLDL